MANVGHTGADGDINQSCTVAKRIVADACHAIGNGEVTQTCTARKCTVANTFHAVGNIGALASGHQFAGGRGYDGIAVVA